MGGQVPDVSLSDEEQARLREIEALTAAEDPRFAAQLDLDRATRRRRHLRAVCWWLLGIGAGLMLVGVGAARGVISLGTMLALVGCGLMMWAAVIAHGVRTRRS